MPAGRIYRATTGTQERKLNRRQVKQVQKIVESNKEIHRLDTNMNGTFNTTGDLYDITAVTEGDNFNERKGDRLQLQQARMCVGFYNTANAYTAIRVMMVRGKYGPLVLADLPAFTGTPDYDNYQVYYDKHFMLGPGITTPSDARINIDFSKAFKNKKVPHLNVGYDDTVSASVAQINPLYVYFVGVDANAVQSYGNAKIKWFDKI